MTCTRASSTAGCSASPEQTGQSVQVAPNPTGAGSEVGQAAHELLNLLSIMRNYTGLVQREVDDPTLSGFLEQVQTAVDKAASVTQRLHEIGRDGG